MVQYYTLEQAAQILRTSPDELKNMIKRKEVRAFQDRGTWRFRAQEIDEMARARGLGSDPELPLGDASAPKSPSPSAGKRKSQLSKPAGEEEDLFDFKLEGGDEGDEVPLGQDPASSKSKASPPPRSPKPGPRRTGSTKSGLGKSPPPKASSDSDVRLVMDGSDLDFQIEVDSDVSVGKAPPPPPSKAPSSKKSPGPKKSRVAPEPPDSGVRIVPLDKPSDSDVKIVPASGDDLVIDQPRIKSPSDSDIRLEEKSGPRDHAPLVTEEIDLDAEASKLVEPPRSRTGKTKGTKPPAPPVLPTSSPFELSEGEITMDQPAAVPAPGEAEEDDSSDFDLTPAKTDDLSPLEPSTGDMPAAPGDEDVSLGELSGAAGASGINLQEPADSGISLEQGGSDEIDFELSLDAGSTPKPAAAASDKDSSSEFELSLDESDPAGTPPPATADDSDSEFELSLDADSSPVGDSDSEFELSLDADSGSAEMELEKVEADSDSEFELTLDESGGLAPIDEEKAAAEESGEKDIFETDFEVPALEEESGSEAVALDEADTDLESSDFDLTPDDSAEEEASGSQVVTLDTDEEADAGAATVQRPAAKKKKKKAAADEEEEPDEGLDLDLQGEPEEEAEEEEEEEAAPAKAAAAPAPPADWGVLAPLGALLCTIVLFIVGLMSFELVQGMMGYHRPGKATNLIIGPIARMFDDKLPKE